MTFSKRALWSALLLITLFTSAYAVQPFMPRYPALSPDGETIIFSFQGDLWSVPFEGGNASRLTAHSAYDGNPVFSADGSKIAFTSDRYGDFDVFLMPATGGAPVRLTYSAAGETPRAFSTDGSTLYYSANQPDSFPVSTRLYKIPSTGGTPFPAFAFYADEIAVGTDGTLVLGIGRVKFGRRHYRGSYQRDIYRFREGTDPVAISDHPGFETNPMIDKNGKVYWLCDNDESMTQNLWSMNLDGTDKTQLTHFVNEDVRSAGVSLDGSRFVLEVGTDLYTLLAGSETPVKLTADVAADLIENPVWIGDKASGADELSVSGGDEFAMIVEGDIVLVNKELGGRATVIAAGPSRESGIAFRPGEPKEMLFVSDRNGQPQIFKANAEDKVETLRESKEIKLSEMTDASIVADFPVWSPDGEKFLYTQGNGDIHVMDAKGKKDQLLFARWRQQWHPVDYSWSPDSKWIAVSVEDADYNTDIFLFPADGSGTPVNITQHPKEDFGPVWSEDGSMLAWTSNRNSRQYDVYSVYLKRSDDERTKEEWEIWEKIRDKQKADDGEEEDDDKKKDKAPKVVIDFEDIHFRARRMTSLPGDEFAIAIHPKGDKLYFTTTIDGDNDLYSVNRFGKELTNVTNGVTGPDAITLLDKTFYFLKSGGPAYVGMDGGSIETTSFNARMTIDYPARRVQVITEGWRMLRDYFYDPNFHGADWNAAKAKYIPWAKKVGHDRDFGDIVNLMLGEINGSHMGYYQPWSSRSLDDDGLLGVTFDPAYSDEGLRIASVFANGPSDKVDSQLMVGDVLLSVNGLRVGRSENVEIPLEQRAGMPTEVEFLRGKKSHTVEIIPGSWRPLSTLQAEEWERRNRAIVEETSGGKVGYVYIRGMGWAEVERFEMNLFAAANGKDALIIDVRDNGGGWTTDFLLTILTQPEHAITVGRDGTPGYPQAERQIFYRWNKPIAVICDESSYSNAEIFSHAIKTIGRGPVVGNTTGGNVISTGGWTTMMPDAWIRLPQRGWYVWGDQKHPERNGMNEEGNGTVPDYLIVRTPADLLHDRDPQLQKAIELMIPAAEEEATKPKPAPKM